jgi:glycosyltransferase involved in cell wall biosynthesis
MRPSSVVILGSAPLSAPPLHEQRMARALSDELDVHVLHVNPPLSPAGIVRGRGRPRPFFSRDRGVSVYQPLTLLPVERQRWRNARLLEFQIERAARRFPSPRLVLDARLSPEIRTPWAAARVCVLKDHNPSGAGLWGRDRAEIERTVLGALAAADRRYAVTEALAGWAADHGHSECSVIPHGWAPNGAPDGPRVAFSSVRRPILLYAGRVDGRVDFEALQRLVDAGVGTVVTVGPWLRSANEDLARHPQVHVLDEVPAESVGAYLRAADCLLLPYRTNEWLSYALPSKLYEYLAAGPPIAASGCLSLQAFRPPLVHYTTAGDLAEAVSKALAADSPGARSARLDCARSNPWSARAEDLLTLVEDL